MTAGFALSFAALTVAQGATTALPRAGAFPRLQRLRTPLWAIIPAASLVGAIVAIDAAGATTDGLTWLALVACPLLAAVALGWSAHGHRPWLALAVAPLFALAWAEKGTAVGDVTALALSALSCVTLGALLAAVAPARWLTAGVALMAVADAYLVFRHQLQPANDLLVAAAPTPSLPRLQFAQLGVANMGYGDLFVAGVAGGVLVNAGRQLRGALLVVVLGLAWGVLFLAVDTIPATVPVAVALLVAQGRPHGRSYVNGRAMRRDTSHEEA